MGRRNLLKTNAFVLHGMVLQASSVQLFNTKMVLESQDLIVLPDLCCLGDLFIKKRLSIQDPVSGTTSYISYLT